MVLVYILVISVNVWRKTSAHNTQFLGIFLYVLLETSISTVSKKSTFFNNLCFVNLKQLSLFTALEDEDSKKDDGISFSFHTGPAWAGSERDYTYDEVKLKMLSKYFPNPAI